MSEIQKSINRIVEILGQCAIPADSLEIIVDELDSIEILVAAQENYIKNVNSKLNEDKFLLILEREFDKWVENNTSAIVTKICDVVNRRYGGCNE